MKIEKRIVVDSKWSTAKRVAVAAAVGVSVCLPLSACNDDDSSPVAPAVETPDTPETPIAPSSSESSKIASSAEGVASSVSTEMSSSSELPTIVNPDSIAPLAGDPIVGPDEFDSFSSSSEVSESSRSVQDIGVEPVLINDSTKIMPTTYPIIRDSTSGPVMSMPSSVGHVQIPLVNV